jgi:outer membrane protein assembly factor BamB
MHGKVILVLLVAALVLSLMPTCTSIPLEDEFSTPHLWTYDLNSTCFGGSAAGDIDGDHLLEVAFGTHVGDGHLYALNGEDGSLLWKFYAGGCSIDSSVRLYDVNNDTHLEVVFSSLSPSVEGAGFIYALNGADGTVLWNYSIGAVSVGGAAIEDIDDDNRPEVIIGTAKNATGAYVHILNAEDGSLSSTVGPFPGDICSFPTVLDLNCDGALDIVIATQGDDNSIYAIDGPSLSTMWRYEGEAGFRGGCAYADLDWDAIQELVIGSADGRIHAINAEDGSILWMYSGESSYYATCIADMGRLFGPEVAAIGEREVLVVNRDGEPSWRYTHGLITISYPSTTPSVSDINGDGDADIFYPDSRGLIEVRDGHGGIILSFNVGDGNPLGKMGVYHSPTIADFDGDGYLDYFMVAGKGDSSDPADNYGQAIVVQGLDGSGSGWPMDRHDGRNSGCFSGFSHVVLISGHVEDGDNHSPIIGARIGTLGGNVSVISDQNGNFSLNLYPGFTTLVTKASGYEPAYMSVTLLDIEGQEFIFRLRLQTNETALSDYPFFDGTVAAVLTIGLIGIILVMVSVRRVSHR